MRETLEQVLNQVNPAILEPGNTDGIGAGGDGKDVSPIFGTAPQPFYLADSPSSYGPVSTGIFGGGGAGAYNQTQGGDGGGGQGANPAPRFS